MLIEKDKPFYTVTQVSEILGISADRLRTYDEENLVSPERVGKGDKRLYSELDIEWLKDLRLAISKNKMNIYSFKLILYLLNHIPQNTLSKLSKIKNDEIWTILERMYQNPNFKKLIK